MSSENRLIEERLKKLRNLRNNNIEPYPYSFDKKNNASEILEKYKKVRGKTRTKVFLAGRIMSLRIMGKVTFGHLQDQTGKIQFYMKADELKNYKILKQFDIGDIIGIKGAVFRTKKGEISIWVTNFVLLAKSLRPLPEKWHGLKDVEARYRQRYLDLMINPEIKEVFIKRSRIISAIREFLNSKGFVEVEIPTLQPIYGGANAKPFKTHLNALNRDLFLSISPELYLKRLLVGGLEKVYTICKNFRNEGVDRTHNPEFTMLEFYSAYSDYNEIMKITEDLVNSVCKKVLGNTKIKYQGKTLNFKKPWSKLTMIQAIKKHAKMDVEKMDDNEIKKILRNHNIVYSNYNRGEAIELIFDELVQDKLIQPTHIIDHPRETTPLCKSKRGNILFIERVEPFVNGVELGNGYSELNNPITQKDLLKEQEKKGRGGDEEAHKMDKDFIRALEFGMPPAGGMGIGIDRLVMLLTDSASIRDVILFPTLKPEN